MIFLDFIAAMFIWFYKLDPNAPLLANVIISIGGMINNMFWVIGIITFHRWANRKRNETKVCAETE